MSHVAYHVSCVICNVSHFFLHQLGPLGRVGLVVAMSVSVPPVPFYVIFEASHWPSGHMVSSRPLIGQPSFTTKLSNPPLFFLFFFFVQKPLGGDCGGEGWKKCLKASWRRCYYLHRSGELVSPVCIDNKKQEVWKSKKKILKTSKNVKKKEEKNRKKSRKHFF